MSESINKYGGKVRVRACGILIEKGDILLIKHRDLGPNGVLWAPPGGGINFQESAENAVIREFMEETGLEVSVSNFAFANEYRDENYHAIELFFEVKRKSGELVLGKDPEFSDQGQLIEEIDWFSTEQIQMMDPNELHNALWPIIHGKNLTELTGFFNFVDNSVK